MASNSIRRIGLLGGTFDPLHFGHIVCGEEALRQFELDEIVFIPAGQPWQKRPSAEAEDRYMMTLVGTAGNSRFSVSRLEVDRTGPTYTLDTIQSFAQFYGSDCALSFIAGADEILGIPTWKGWQSLVKSVEIIGATRTGFDLEQLNGDLAGAVREMKIPDLEVSSTQIRRLVRAGSSIDHLTPAPVVSYIKENTLYRGPDPTER